MAGTKIWDRKIADLVAIDCLYHVYLDRQNADVISVKAEENRSIRQISIIRTFRAVE